jgi:folate-binding protein YgfZ
MTASTPSPWAWVPPGPRLLEQPVSLLHFSGPDTLRVLHGQTSQALQDARPGDWRSTCCLTPTARLRGLAEVVVVENGAWLVLTAGDGAAVRTAFDRVLFPADQVELGPLQVGRWIRLVGQPPTPPPGPWRPLEGGGGWWLGSNLLMTADTPLPQILADVPPLGEEEAAFWRLQQGVPACPEEINDAFNPFELGLADRVSLNKGCYVGQETLAKLASTDGVKQQLRRWQASPTPEAPQALAVGALLQTADGTRAGQITSCLQLADGSWVGLAMVRRQALECPTLGAVVGTSTLPVRLSIPEAFSAPPAP